MRTYRKPTTMRRHGRFTEAQGSRYDGAERIYSGEGYDVYKITTPEAARYYGETTHWSIVGINKEQGRETFNSYKKYFGVKAFYFIIPQGSRYGKYYYADCGKDGFFKDYMGKTVTLADVEDVLPASVIDSLPGLSMAESYRRHGRFTEAKSFKKQSSYTDYYMGVADEDYAENLRVEAYDINMMYKELQDAYKRLLDTLSNSIEYINEYSEYMGYKEMEQVKRVSDIDGSVISECLSDLEALIGRAEDIGTL